MSTESGNESECHLIIEGLVLCDTYVLQKYTFTPYKGSLTTAGMESSQNSCVYFLGIC